MKKNKNTSMDFSKIISRKNPNYDENKLMWDFYESTYKGGPSWFKDNIFQYIKEGAKSFSDRTERAYRFNHTKEVVDTITKYIFKSNILRSDDAPKELKDFWETCTIFNKDVTSLAKCMDKNSSIYGRVYIVVDSKSDGEIRTKQDEKDKNFKTYAYVVKPQMVKDYSYDEYGNLNWILIEECIRENESPFDSDIYIRQFRLWDRERWLLIKLKSSSETNEVATYPNSSEGFSNIIETVETGVHGLGVVPVIHLDCVESEDLDNANSLISDISFLDRALANYLSNLDVIIQDQTFSQLVIPAESLPQAPSEDGNDGSSHLNAIMDMGTKSVFTYSNAQGSKGPEYISPDPKQAQVLLEVINKIIAEIYHTVGLSSERTKQDNSVGIDNSSGVAKAYDFEKINTLLSSKAKNLQDAENKICQLVLRWYGKSDDRQDYVLYPQDFDVKNLYDEFEISSQLSLLDAPEDVRREQMKMVINKLFPQIKKSIREEMIENLKNWPEKELEVTETLSKSESGNAKGSTSYTDKESEDENIAKAAEGSRQGQVTSKTE